MPDEILLFLPYLLKITFMEKVKKLYPLKFQQITIDNSWGSENIGIADLGIEDSVVTDGWLEGNSMGDIMETYIERVVGESVYGYYGRQFPLLVKFVDIKGDTPVFVHPGDEVAEQRYDALGGKGAVVQKDLGQLFRAVKSRPCLRGVVLRLFHAAGQAPELRAGRIVRNAGVLAGVDLAANFEQGELHCSTALIGQAGAGLVDQRIEVRPKGDAVLVRVGVLQ